MSWLEDKTTEFLQTIDQLKQQDAFPFFRPFENIGTRVKIGRQSYINFTSNDYLGLSQHPNLIRQAVSGTQRYGTGLGSSRLQASTDRHAELERRLARFMRYPACAVFTTGYQSVVGTLATYLDDDCVVVLDNLSHASILDGAAVAKGSHPKLEMRFFKHNSVRGLKRVLSSCKGRKVLVVVEGLYGADGDVAPLDEIVPLCKEHGAAIFVDDAHGIGSMGPSGRGTAEAFGVLGEVDLLMGSFSKSFGTVGGFICASQSLIDFLKVSARSFIYSASLPLAQVGAAAAALELMESDSDRLQRLRRNTEWFREGLLRLGYNLGESAYHITPLMIGDEEKAVTAAAYLYHGAHVIMLPFVYPGVPKGKARLRCNVTAAHGDAEMGYALEALAVVGSKLGLIPSGASTGAGTTRKLIWLAENKLRGLRNAGPGYLAAEATQAYQKLDQWARGKLGVGATNDEPETANSPSSGANGRSATTTASGSADAGVTQAGGVRDASETRPND
jgi:8-amino-7-oxononanoate synthase